MRDSTKTNKHNDVKHLLINVDFECNIIRSDTYESNNYSLIGSFDYTTEMVLLQQQKRQHIKQQQNITENI